MAGMGTGGDPATPDRRNRAWLFVVVGVVLAVAGFAALGLDTGTWRGTGTLAMVLGAGLAIRGAQLLGRARRRGV